MVAVEACAVIRLAQTTKLKGKLIFAATADEEVGPALACLGDGASDEACRKLAAGYPDIATRRVLLGGASDR